MNSSPQTGPAPLFGSGDDLGAQRIAFDVAAESVKAVVRFDGKRFAPALVDGAGS